MRLLAPADDASARTAAMRRLLVGSFVMRVHFAMRAGLVEA